MMKLMLGFAAGYWVGSRMARGQQLVPEDVRTLAAKYAAEVSIIDSGAEGDRSETVPSVIGGERLDGFDGYRRMYRVRNYKGW